MTIKPQFYV